MIWRVRLHPVVQDDLVAIADLVEAHAGTQVAARKLAEIEAVSPSLSEMPPKGRTQSDIAPGLRAIPAGRKGVIVFTVDEGAGEVLVHAVGYAGSDWIARSGPRRQGPFSRAARLRPPAPPPIFTPVRGNPDYGDKRTCNRRLGPGGGTRRLHQSTRSLRGFGAETGSTNVQRGQLSLGEVPPLSVQDHSCQ